VTRDTDDWAGDGGLYHRLRDCMLVLSRGAGSFEDRANYAVERLRPIRSADFPADLQPVFERVQALDRESVIQLPHLPPLLRTSRLTPRRRKILTDAIFNLYEEMLKARTKRGMED
jgi:hypothetical protein